MSSWLFRPRPQVPYVLLALVLCKYCYLFLPQMRITTLRRTAPYLSGDNPSFSISKVMFVLLERVNWLLIFT